jgi:hypothetical protein
LHGKGGPETETTPGSPFGPCYVTFQFQAAEDQIYYATKSHPATQTLFTAMTPYLMVFGS